MIIIQEKTENSQSPFSVSPHTLKSSSNKENQTPRRLQSQSSHHFKKTQPLKNLADTRIRVSSPNRFEESVGKVRRDARAGLDWVTPRSGKWRGILEPENAARGPENHVYFEKYMADHSSDCFT